jgi:HAD superfamily hydrolase (TIGR01490 family)
VSTNVSTVDELSAEIANGPAGPRVAAFFDFDGTLIDGYSALAFYRHRAGRFEIGLAEAAAVLQAGLGGAPTEEQFEHIAGLALRGWQGRSEDELYELGERLFRQDIAGSFFPEAWRLVRAHRRAGHTVVIASSATRFQAQPLARELGVEHLLCTPAEAEDGILTGRIGGEVPYGAGKARALRAFAEEHAIDLSRSYAYSNGDEDVPFLSTVGRPQVVNPQQGLARTAVERGWPVHRFVGRGRPGPGQILRTAASWGGVFTGFGAGLALGGLNRDRRQAIDAGFSLAGDLGLALAGIDVEVQGAEHLWSQRPAVFILNHQSSLVDALVMFKLVRSGFTGVAKKEAAGIPGVGQFFRFARVAFVDRGNTAQAKEVLAPAVERLGQGVSLVLSPEGTRSYTPGLGPFKKGAFHVAMQAGVPIVPVVIRNAGELMARNSKTTRSGVVQVAVNPPIPTGDWTVADLDDRVAEIRGLFLDTLDNWPEETT